MMHILKTWSAAPLLPYIVPINDVLRSWALEYGPRSECRILRFNMYGGITMIVPVMNSVKLQSLSKVQVNHSINKSFKIACELNNIKRGSNVIRQPNLISFTNLYLISDLSNRNISINFNDNFHFQHPYM